jgi:beta-glucanase (GH16 family)
MTPPGNSAAPLPRASRLRRRAAAVAGAIALVAAAGAITAPRTADAAIPPPAAGYSLVFGDDFNGASGSLPSTANWRFDLGHGYPGGPANWGTGEIQNYTNSPSNISLDGAGNLRITPRRDGAGNWTSARIETNRGDFKAPAGGVLRIEARIQMPNVTGASALGYWPAFWALGSPYRGNWWNWPGIGEFDIMENVNGINSVWGVLHCGVAPGGPCNENNGIGASRPCVGSTCQAGFHTFRFEWDRSVTPNQFRWYNSGELYQTVSQNQLPADTWNNMTSHAGYFILLNVAMGGAFPNGVAGGGTPTAATVPDRPMVVDYVAVWTRGGSGTGNPTGQPLKSALGNKCADVRGGSSASGTRIQLWDCGGGETQRWTRTGNTLRAYGKCLDIQGGGASPPGTAVILWDCQGSQNQDWQLRADQSVYNARTNMCLETPASNTANGTGLIAWPCDGRPKQRWVHG